MIITPVAAYDVATGEAWGETFSVVENDLAQPREEGSLVAWGGSNYFGECNVPAGDDFIYVDAGGSHSVAIRSNGSLVAWGMGSYGQCNVPEGNDFVDVAAGGYHSVALRSDGSLVAWGYNGQYVPAGNDFVDVAAGGCHSIALRSDGSLVAWGDNYAGQCNVPSGNDFIDVAAGETHCLALRSDGAIVSWGEFENYYNPDDYTSANEIYSNCQYISMDGGELHTVALRSDGSLGSWGANFFNECNCPSGNDYTAVSAGYSHSVALRSDGTLVAWGSNNYGQCDVPTGDDFTMVTAGNSHNVAIEVITNDPPTFQPIEDIIGDSGQNIEFDVFAFDLDGDALTYTAVNLPSNAIFIDQTFSWTPNEEQVGTYELQFIVDDGTVQSTIGVNITVFDGNQTLFLPSILNRQPGSLDGWGYYHYYVDYTVPSGNDFVKIDSCGGINTALRSDGSLDAWGDNLYGQCNVPEGNHFVDIAAGGMNCLALRSDGSLVAWGSNNYNLCNIPNGNDYVAIASGSYHNLALRSDCSLVAWGYNNKGQCNVPEGNHFVDIAAGSMHSLALCSDGSLVAWGDSRTHRCDVPSGNDFIDIAACKDYSLALRSDGSLVAWGYNDEGQCNVPEGNDFVDIAAGSTHCIALRSDGSLVAWGDNSRGQCNVPDGNNFIDVAAAYGYTVVLEVISNHPPLLQPIEEMTQKSGEIIKFNVTASDEDGDTLTYSALNLPTNATFTEQNFSWTPTRDQVGTYEVQFVADDGTAQSTLSVNITVLFGNHAPVLNDGTIPMADEGSAYSYVIPVTDPDNDQLSFTVDETQGTPPEGLSLNPDTGEITWIPDYTQAGTYTFTVVISDSHTSIEAEITITVSNVNRGPDASDQVAPALDEGGDGYVYDIIATDPDGDALDYSSTNMPEGMELDSGTGRLTWTPTYDQAGEYSFTVDIGDGESMVTITVTITVKNVNRAPVRKDEFVPMADEGYFYSYNVPFTDPDNDPLTFTIDETQGTPPLGLFLHPENGEIIWTPDYNQAGIYTFYVIISDGYTSVKAKITILVNDVNRAPAAIDQAAPELNEGSDGYAYDIIAADPDGDTLTYSSADLPEGMVLDSQSGIITWTPTYDQSGEYTFTVDIGDREATVTITITITVINVNRPPIAAFTTVLTGDEGSVHAFDASGSTDPDGDALTYAWDFGDGEGAVGVLPTHVYADNGEYTVTLTVTDPDGLSDGETSSIVIANIAPIIDPVIDQTVPEGSTVTIQTSVTDPGTADTHEAVINWGDGSAEETIPVQNMAVSASHIYADNGVCPVSIIVTDDDGVAAEAGCVVTVENVAPSLGEVSDQILSEGSDFLLEVTVSDPGTADTHEAVINWGDGSAEVTIPVQNMALSASHLYADNGACHVSIIVTDDDGAAAEAGCVVTVENVAPSLGEVSDQTLPEGSDFILEVMVSDPGTADTHEAVINWGDGSISETVLIQDQFLSTTHLYADNGNYPVTFTVTDDDGAGADASCMVTVLNIAPVVDAGSDHTVSEGESISFDGTFSDPGLLDTHEIVWTFDDGTTVEGVLSTTRTYADDGEYSVTLTVTDDDGGVGEDTITVMVENVAPTTEIGDVQAAFAGETIPFSGAFTDPGVEDTHTIIWSFGDGATVEGLLEPTHIYADAGTYTITMTVTDDDGGVSCSSAQITITPMPATIDLDPDTLNLNSKGVITAYITLPDGFDSTGIDETTVLCNGIPADKCTICDDDPSRYMAKFDREEMFIDSVGDSVPFSICGRVSVDGLLVEFAGSDSIRVIDKGIENKEGDEKESNPNKKEK